MRKRSVGTGSTDRPRLSGGGLVFGLHPAIGPAEGPETHPKTVTPATEMAIEGEKYLDVCHISLCQHTVYVTRIRIPEIM
jgi:hypothetical protein